MGRGREGEDRTEARGYEPGARAWSQNLVFIPVYLLLGSVNLEKVQNLTKFPHFSPVARAYHWPSHRLPWELRKGMNVKF